MHSISIFQRSVFVALTTLSVSIHGFAQSQDESVGQSKTSAQVGAQKTPSALNSLSFAAGYSFADQIQVKNSGSSDTDVYKTDGAPSLAARYGLNVADKVSVLLGGTFEFARKIKSITVAGSTFDTGDNKPAYSMLLLEPNVAYSLTSNLFAFGGANFPLIFKSGEWADTSVRGELGAQIGVGYLPVDRVSVELLYRTMNMTFQNGDQKSDQARSWGPQLRMSYAL